MYIRYYLGHKNDLDVVLKSHCLIFILHTVATITLKSFYLRLFVFFHTLTTCIVWLKYGKIFPYCNILVTKCSFYENIHYWFKF